MTTKELVALASGTLAVGKKTVFAFAGGRWFRRVGPDEWVECVDA